ncbi:MAG: amidohydrolase family protein [Planctomycetota bacterium]|jgi:predicted TIM-barrel fold metal-dependent hydrolase
MPGDLRAQNHELIDAHFHVGLIGDRWPNWGGMRNEYRKKLIYKTFLLYAGIKESDVSDRLLRRKTIETISESKIDKVICLALDPVYDEGGILRKEASNIWVDNEYVLELQRELPDRILLGASVHPYDPNFKERVRIYVDKGAVLLKWLPSAQQIDLADERVKRALKFLAKAGINDRPLPLLLHSGPEYAIPSTDKRTSSYDYLNWTKWDGIVNFFRFGKKRHVPKVDRIHNNLNEMLQEGGYIIFAHCGLPYIFQGVLGKAFEHSEFDIVRGYLARSSQREFAGRCFADVSACATPFRKVYFDKLKELPEDTLLFGSDFPTPVFEISADLKENWRDFKAVMKGHLERIVVPQDNLLDVNYRELAHFFPDHPMFTNFSRHLMKSTG